HVAPAPSTPRVPRRRTTLPPRSTSRDRSAALRTKKSSALGTKQLPVQCPRARRLRSIENPRRRSTSECPFVAHQQHCELLTLGGARLPTAKARRKFPPESTRLPPPKTL